jgi:diguanylate cyclase (GGDEF)-like protein
MAEKPMPTLSPPTPWQLSTLVAPVSAVSSRRRAVLTVLVGNDTGRVIPLSGGVSLTFGRRETCTHRIDDPSVSGNHARVIAMQDEYMIADEGSTNGTYVNGTRLGAPVKLTDGDRVHFGQVLLRFSLVDEAEELALKSMYDAALRDALTGVFNRKHLEERLDAELAFARRHPNNQLSVIIFDVDHFKRVNDTHGHLVGDAVLKAVASSISRGVRTEDLVARYGGEEFVVVAREVRASVAFSLAQRLRQVIEQSVVSQDGKEIRVTASAGVASLECCGEQRDKATLFGVADKRLYTAKQGGRNRVVGP